MIDSCARFVAGNVMVTNVRRRDIMGLSIHPIPLKAARIVLSAHPLAENGRLVASDLFQAFFPLRARLTTVGPTYLASHPPLVTVPTAR